MSQNIKTSKVIWKKLASDDLIQCGDMISRNDPNTPEKQTGNDYNLQMQAVHVDCHGRSVYQTSSCDESCLWRPVGIVKTETIT